MPLIPWGAERPSPLIFASVNTHYIVTRLPVETAGARITIVGQRRRLWTLSRRCHPAPAPGRFAPGPRACADAPAPVSEGLPPSELPGSASTSRQLGEKYLLMGLVRIW